MSHKRLDRARGTIITCDAGGCSTRSQTGQVYPRDHAAYLRRSGWLIRPHASQRYLCPEHGAVKTAELEETKNRVAAEKQRLAAVRRERKRRDALTPEQRKTEDKQRAKDRRAAKRATQAAAA